LYRCIPPVLGISVRILESNRPVGFAMPFTFFSFYWNITYMTNSTKVKWKISPKTNSKCFGYCFIGRRFFTICFFTVNTSFMHTIMGQPWVANLPMLSDNTRWCNTKLGPNSGNFVTQHYQVVVCRIHKELLECY